VEGHYVRRFLLTHANPIAAPAATLRIRSGQVTLLSPSGPRKTSSGSCGHDRDGGRTGLTNGAGERSGGDDGGVGSERGRERGGDPRGRLNGGEGDGDSLSFLRGDGEVTLEEGGGSRGWGELGGASDSFLQQEGAGVVLAHLAGRAGSALIAWDAGTVHAEAGGALLVPGTWDAGPLGAETRPALVICCAGDAGTALAHLVLEALARREAGEAHAVQADVQGALVALGAGHAVAVGAVVGGTLVVLGAGQDLAGSGTEVEGAIPRSVIALLREFEKAVAAEGLSSGDLGGWGRESFGRRDGCTAPATDGTQEVFGAGHGDLALLGFLQLPIATEDFVGNERRSSLPLAGR
jgi:hypothetical protein